MSERPALLRSTRQLCGHVRERCALGSQCDQHVVYEVRSLLDGLLDAPRGECRDQLGALLTELLEAQVTVFEQAGRVAALRSVGSACLDRGG